ncbi:MAG TPA: NUDIX domain-containing protein [Pyrinomonadaceae bacterium]|nr:NUDIX domain-containing protein [Pyrinomonadaceae bacterium]
MSATPTKLQISAGGVAFRRRADRVEVALISVGTPARWQLPKGLVDRGESSMEAAAREVREEAGIETETLGLIERVEYWYYATERGTRVRFHKFVDFYLMRYRRGDVRRHDHEVNEARWVEIGQAARTLAFKSERGVLEKARAMIEQLDADAG